MRILSSNQWKYDENSPAWAEKGEDCSAEARVEGLVRAYQQIAPDVLGIQEASVRMNELLMQRMSRFEKDGQTLRYELITGGDTPLLYRPDRLLLIESGFFRYSEQVPGLEGSFNNHETKSYAFGVFEERANGRRFAVMTTHLWWKSSKPGALNYQAHSAEARAYQIRLALTRLEAVTAQYACPGVLVGDLNAAMGSLCLQTAEEMGWVDAHELATSRRSDTRGHHPCGPKGYTRAEPGTFEQAIDHILVRRDSGLVIRDYLRLEDEWFDRISDHYPLYMTFDDSAK